MKFKKIALALSALLISTSILTGCKGKTGEDSAAQKGSAPTTLKIYFQGDIKGKDRITKEFENRTKDSLNIKLDINTITNADYKEKMRLMMTAGEEMDLVFDAKFLNLSSFAADGVYADLTKYYNNDQYPGLKKAFSQDFIKANQILGQNITVPITQSYTDIAGLMIRKDLREKYGLGEIKNDTDLVKYFETVKAKEPSMSPIGIAGNRGFYQVMPDESTVEDRQRIVQVGATTIPFKVLLSADYKKVLNVYTGGDSAQIYALNAGTLDAQDPFARMWSKFADLKKYAQKDSIAAQTADVKQLFTSGKIAAFDSEVSTFTGLRDALKKSVPSADIEFYAYNPDIRAKKQGVIVSSYSAWNFLCVPKSSKKIDTTMKFIDWIFQSQDNHDLFELGIEGQDWVKVGNDQYKLPDALPQDVYNFPGYELTWNSNYIRYNSTVPAEVTNYLKYEADQKSFVYSKTAGFTFNNANVKTEIASVSALGDTIYKPLQHGVAGDPAVVLAKYNADAKKVGLDTIREEIRKQMQDYLDKNNK